jgi:hypothetical protein
MSRSPRRALVPRLALGFALLTAACADTAPPTAAGRPPAAPTLAKATKSAAGGAGAVIVFRDIIGQFWGGDPRDQLALMVGFEASIAEVCAAMDPLFGDVSPGIGRAVITPSGRAHFTAFSREARVVVVQYGAGNLGMDLCPLVGAPVVASGTVTYTYRANFDLNGAGQTLRATAQGIVDLASGGQARLDAVGRFVARPDGTVVVDVQRVQLTPL